MANEKREDVIALESCIINNICNKNLIKNEHITQAQLSSAISDRVESNAGMITEFNKCEFLKVGLQENINHDIGGTCIANSKFLVGFVVFISNGYVYMIEEYIIGDINNISEPSDCILWPVKIEAIKDIRCDS